MSGSYTPSLQARHDVLTAVLAAADAMRRMPCPLALAHITRRSLSVVHASLAALHDDGTLTLGRGQNGRQVATFIDGTQTA